MNKKYLIPALVCIALILTGYLLSRTTLRADVSPKENKLVLYTSVNLDDIKPIVDSFTKLTGMEVDVWKGSGSAVVTRILEESKANKLKADVVILNAQRMSILSKEGVLLPYQNKLDHPFCEQYITLAYNTKRVSVPPKSYEELFSPKYADQLAFEIDSIEWEIGLRDQLGNNFFDTLQKKLDKQEIRGVDGKRFLTELLVSGEVAIAINLPNNFTEDAKNTGAPVEWLPIEPVVAHAQTAALLSDSEQGKEFIDFLLSKEGQQAVLIAGRGAPIDKSLKSPLYTDFKTVTPKFH